MPQGRSETGVFPARGRPHRVGRVPRELQDAFASNDRHLVAGRKTTTNQR
jgi:hypothetical protein